MKYIDAGLLRKAIEEERKSIEGLFIEGDNNFYDGQDDAYNHTLALIDSLQQKQPELPQIERAEYYYHKGVYEGLSQGRADALKMLDEFMKRQANPVIVIKQQEQPEVDLNAEIEKELRLHYNDDQDVYWWNYLKNSFRHFYELGLKARKKE